MNNIEGMIDEIRKIGARKVMIQLPEGLKTGITGITDEITKNGIEVVVWGDPSYGACDLADRHAKTAGCDMLVHIGHSKFYVDVKTEVPVLYYPWTFDINIDNIDFSAISGKRVGLITNIQHMKLLSRAAEMLREAGKDAVIGGQVLGCWYTNAEKIENSVDCFLFVGSGVFHSLGLKTDKPVYGVDLEKSKVELLDMSLLEKRRYAHIFNARNARSFAILVTSKAGQNNLTGRAETIAQYLKEKDKKAYIIVMDYITDSKLMGIKADAFINTACPRLLDDSWSRPFINAGDVEKIFAEE